MTNLKTTNLRYLTAHGMAAKVRAEYGIRTTNTSYFTVTLEGWNKYASTNNDIAFGGADHDTARRAFPQLADLIALHLSDAETGAPMYALENGWYHFQQSGAGIASEYLRVTPNHLDGVATKEDFARVVESLRPQWAAEAKAARENHGLTI